MSKKIVIEFDDIPPPRGVKLPTGAEVMESIKKQISNIQIRRIYMPLPNNYGVENFVALEKTVAHLFNKIEEAKQDDGKISLLEGLVMGVSLAPEAFDLISKLPNIPKEIVFDQISEEDFAQISSALDEFEYLKGDTRDAARELLEPILKIKDWYFKYFVRQESPPV